MANKIRNMLVNTIKDRKELINKHLQWAKEQTAKLNSEILLLEEFDKM